MVDLLKKFYKPFAITYILLSIALGSYPMFDFYTFKGQFLIFSVLKVLSTFQIIP